LRRGRRREEQEIVSPTMARGADLSFELTVRVRSEGDGSPNLLGPFVYGPRGERYLAVTSGTLAGQMDSCWTRGVKVKLQPITWELIRQVEAHPEAVLEASIAGKAKDGGPACATVPLLEGGWRMVANS